MLKYKLHDFARSDVKQVIQYYEEEREGLGSEFFQEFKATQRS